MRSNLPHGALQRAGLIAGAAIFGLLAWVLWTVGAFILSAFSPSPDLPLSPL